MSLRSRGYDEQAGDSDSMEAPRTPTPDEKDAAQRAFESFVDRSAATVLRFCLGRTSDRHAAEDAAQEALLRVHRAYLEGRSPTEPLSWTLAVARKCCQEAERARRRHTAQPLDESTVQPSRAEAEVPDFQAAVSQLSDSEQALLHLKHTEGLRCRQIAEVLGQPLGTVTAALCRIYGKLRPRMLAEMEL